MPRFLLAALSALCVLAGCAAAPPPADAVLLGRVFDARAGRVIEDGAVVVADGAILCAGRARDCRWSPRTPVHDHGRSLLLPGLIDLHVHARPHYLGAFLPSGVTTVRDANNTLDLIAAMRATAGAPRILASGPMLDGEGNVFSGGPSPLGSRPLGEIMPITVAGADDATASVRALAGAGVEWIKLYEQVPAAAFEAAMRAADAAGLPVMADLGTVLTRGLTRAEVDAVQAARAGVSSLEHLSGAALAYRRLGGDPLAGVLDDALLDRIVGEIAASGMAVVPTVGNARQFAAPGSLVLDGLPGVERMRPHFAGYWTYLEGAVSGERAATHGAADLRFVSALLPRLQAAGVPIGAGSDLPAAPYMLPGGALHQELAALVDAGLEPAQALQSATHVAARILGRDDIGRLEAGARADIVVVDGDPLADIRDSRRIAAVWFGGEALDLDAAWRAVDAALEAAAAEEAAGDAA